MAEHILTRELQLALPRAEAFEFFADAANPERITPPELSFHIVTPQPIELREGALIDYKLSIHGLPMKWRTEITKWNPPYEFVDTQLSGPYAQWIHRHTFTELGPSETLVEDEVRYRLTLEPLGDIVHFLVRKQLEYIFDYRSKAIAEILGTSRNHGSFDPASN